MKLTNIVTAFITGASLASAQLSLNTRYDPCTTKYGKIPVLKLGTIVIQSTARTYKSTVYTTVTPTALVVKTATYTGTTTTNAATSTIQLAGATQSSLVVVTIPGQTTVTSGTTVQTTVSTVTTSVSLTTSTTQATSTPTSFSTPLTTITTTETDYGVLSTLTETRPQNAGYPGTVLIILPSSSVDTSGATFRKRHTTLTITATTTAIAVVTGTAQGSLVKRHAFGYVEARGLMSYPTTVTCSQHIDVYTTITVTKTARTVQATTTTTISNIVSVTGTVSYTTQQSDTTVVQTTLTTSLSTVYVTTTVTSTSTSTIVSSTVSTVISTATTLPDGTCLSDNVNYPVLDYDATANGYTGTLTPSGCADFCYEKIYEYAGLFNDEKCLCGDSINTYTPPDGSDEISSGVVVAQSFCYNQCVGDSDSMAVCGGDRFVLFYNAAPTVNAVDTCTFTRSSMKSSKMKIKRHLGWMQEYIPEPVVRGHAKAEGAMIGAFAWFHKTETYKNKYVKYMRKIDSWRANLSERGITTEKVGL